MAAVLEAFGLFGLVTSLDRMLSPGLLATMRRVARTVGIVVAACEATYLYLRAEHNSPTVRSGS